jgi:predicted DCC family thiol-disulfide oxidoreductase YuxK
MPRGWVRGRGSYHAPPGAGRVLTSAGVHPFSGWTGGQYSLCRGLLGIVLALRLLGILLGRGAADGAAILGGAAVAAALLFAAGWRDRLMAALLLLLLPLVVVLAPIATTPGGWGAAWLLIAHLAVPPAPYGSLDARGRVDPRGGWRMPAALPWMHRVAFVALAVALVVRGGIGFDVGVAVMLGLLAFDPGWIPGRHQGRGGRPRADRSRSGARTPRPDTLFYDGTCGLCHTAVRFFLAEDARGNRFRFGTLQGRTFERTLTADLRATLPDSLVLLTRGGRVLTRAAAVWRALATLGGYWRALAAVGGLIPRVVTDAAYDGIARIRHRLFRRPPEACPILPPDLRERFLADGGA